MPDHNSTPDEISRRRFIESTTLAVGAIAGVFAEQATAQPPSSGAPDSQGAELVDTHVYVSRWPFRRVPGDELPDLVRGLKGHGVTSAWAGSFDALLHQDIAAVNARLAEECKAQKEIELLPFGAVNPMLPDWEEDLRRCHEVHQMRGVRLHPDFHGYALAEPRFERLLELATRRGLIVQIGLGMEDPRLQPPLARVPPVNPEPLVELLPKFPQSRVVLLNFWRSFRTVRGLSMRLSRLPQVIFDMATVEGVAGIESSLEADASLRLLYGSYAPFYNFGSSWLKLHESVLTPQQLAAIRCGHARKLLAPA